MLAVRLDKKLQKHQETLSKRTDRFRGSYTRETLERCLDGHGLDVAAYEQSL
jgi:predicted DNA-binding protein